jgi:hypothetical protein
MSIYQIYQSGTTDAILKTDFGWIPADPMNVDYVEYLAWVADGNTAEEWQPNDVEPETTQPDMEEEI